MRIGEAQLRQLLAVEDALGPRAGALVGGHGQPHHRRQIAHRSQALLAGGWRVAQKVHGGVGHGGHVAGAPGHLDLAVVLAVVVEVLEHPRLRIAAHDAAALRGVDVEVLEGVEDAVGRNARAGGVAAGGDVLVQADLQHLDEQAAVVAQVELQLPGLGAGGGGEAEGRQAEEGSGGLRRQGARHAGSKRTSLSSAQEPWQTQGSGDGCAF